MTQRLYIRHFIILTYLYSAGDKKGSTRGGKAIIVEDLAYHPLLNLYRRLTPRKHTRLERPLRSEDVECVVAGFAATGTNTLGYWTSSRHRIIR